MNYKPLIALALLLPAFAWADKAHRPPPRAGLWLSTMKDGGSDRAFETRLCVDAGSKRNLPSADPGEWVKRHGGKISETVDGNTIHAVVVVKVPELGKHAVMTTEMTLLYIEDVNETIEVAGSVHASLDPPSSDRSHDTIFDEHWAGPCPADMKPGDVTVDGRKIDKTKKAK
jgi:hypothetical protein